VNWLEVEMVSKQYHSQVSWHPGQVIIMAALKRNYLLNKSPLFMEFPFICLTNFKFGEHRKANFLF